MFAGMQRRRKKRIWISNVTLSNFFIKSLFLRTCAEKLMFPSKSSAFITLWWRWIITIFNILHQQPVNELTSKSTQSTLSFQYLWVSGILMIWCKKLAWPNFQEFKCAMRHLYESSKIKTTLFWAKIQHKIQHIPNAMLWKLIKIGV